MSNVSSVVYKKAQELFKAGDIFAAKRLFESNKMNVPDSLLKACNKIDSYQQEYLKKQMQLAVNYEVAVNDPSSDALNSCYALKDWLGAINILCLNDKSDDIPAGCWNVLMSFMDGEIDEHQDWLMRLYLIQRIMLTIDSTITFEETEYSLVKYAAYGQQKALLTNLNHDPNFLLNKIYHEELSDYEDLNNSFLTLSNGRQTGHIVKGQRSDTVYNYGQDYLYESDFDEDDLAICKAIYDEDKDDFIHTSISKLLTIDLDTPDTAKEPPVMFKVIDAVFESEGFYDMLNALDKTPNEGRFMVWRCLRSIWDARVEDSFLADLKETHVSEGSASVDAETLQDIIGLTDEQLLLINDRIGLYGVGFDSKRCTIDPYRLIDELPDEVQVLGLVDADINASDLQEDCSA